VERRVKMVRKRVIWEANGDMIADAVLMLGKMEFRLDILLESSVEVDLIS
jgi:hypothetical protein